MYILVKCRVSRGLVPPTCCRCVIICKFPGELYNEAAEAAMEAMKGKLANKYYMLADEAYAEMEE